MCGGPILGRQITLHAFKMHSAEGEVGAAEEARVERDVEEQKERTREGDTEEGGFRKGKTKRRE